MAKVKTARGETIDIDELIDSASRPIVKQANSTIAPKVEPKKKALNMRGHRPTPVAAPPAQAPAQKAQVAKAPAASFSGGTATSLADLTGVKIDKQKYTKGKGKGEVNPDDTLNEILSDLKATTKDVTGIKDEPLA